MPISAWMQACCQLKYLFQFSRLLCCFSACTKFHKQESCTHEDYLCNRKLTPPVIEHNPFLMDDAARCVCTRSMVPLPLPSFH